MRDRGGWFGLAEQLAGAAVDEMEPRAGLADHCFIGAMRIVRRHLLGDPVLHVHAGAGTFENDIGHMTGKPGTRPGPAS